MLIKELKKAGKNPIHSQGSWFGQSEIDAQRAKVNQRLQELLKGEALIAGAAQKPYIE
jgi:hypothetical protein